VYLPTLSIRASKCISEFTRCRRSSACPNSLDHGFKVHLRVHLISSSECMSKLARSRLPSASLSPLNLGLKVPLRSRSITASKFISNQPRRVYRDTRAMEVDRADASIYPGDPGLDRHHCIFISSYHPKKIRTMWFPTFRLTRSFRDFMDPHGWVVSYLLTLCLLAPSFHHNGLQVVLL